MKQPTSTKLLKEIDAEFAANGDRSMNAEERHAARWVFSWLLSKYDLTPKPESEVSQ